MERILLGGNMKKVIVATILLIEKLNSFITKYYDIENPEQYKAIWFVSYEINDGKELSSIYIDAQSGEVLSSWLISDENGDVLDKSFLGK